MTTSLFELPESPVRFIRHAGGSVTPLSSDTREARHAEAIGRMAALLLSKSSNCSYYSQRFLVVIDKEVCVYQVRAYFGYDRVKRSHYISDIEVEEPKPGPGETDRANYRFLRDGEVVLTYNCGITNNILKQINDRLETAILFSLAMAEQL